MRIGGIILGLILAASGQVLGLLLAGVGHGWTTAFFASFALWLFLPLTLATTPSKTSGRPLRIPYAMVLLLAGLIADAALIVATMHEATYRPLSQMVRPAGPFIILWLLIWFSWQGVLILALIRRGKGAHQ